MEIIRETRGETRWVHIHGSGALDTDALNRRAGAEARKWAKELGMTSGGSVSGGGEYGNEWRHSNCYIFRTA